MEDFSFTQLPSASSSKCTVEQQMDHKNVVWGASIPGSDNKKPDKSVEKPQGELVFLLSTVFRLRKV